MTLEKTFESNFHIYLADFLTSISSSKSKLLNEIIQELFFALENGHTCLYLSELYAQKYTNLEFDTFEKWCESWKDDSIIGSTTNKRPLILHNNRLYLYRYWSYEKNIIENFQARATGIIKFSDLAGIKSILIKYFPSGFSEEFDFQLFAALTAVFKKLTIISGGPGTGKTTTILKLIAILCELNRDKKNFQIALAAPTGKAAMRLSESIAAQLKNLPCDDTIRTQIPSEPLTIHRLLGYRTNSPYFIHSKSNQLPHDLVIVDEASMIDVALMAKLLEAIKPDARVVLCGDKDQLCSVEAGSVFAELCASCENDSYSEEFLQKITSFFPQFQNPPSQSSNFFHDSAVTLKKNFRFGSDSGIFAISQAVNNSDLSMISNIKKNKNFHDITWNDLPQADRFHEMLHDYINKYFKPIPETEDLRVAFRLLNSFRLLTPFRTGPYGVVALNRLIERYIKPKETAFANEYYKGKPILITSNDYNLQLFNGDTGIVFPDQNETGNLKAFFESAHGEFRVFSLQSLPSFEPAFAMTIHKSQGSEFDKTLVVLPEIESPILTKELLYTGLTRARKSVEIWGSIEKFCQVAQQKTFRYSGIYESLKNGFSKNM